MIIDFSKAQLSQTAIRSQAKKADTYVRRLFQIAASKEYDQPESSIVLPDDAGLFRQSVRFAEKFRSRRVRAIVVVGIGGSNLGTKALYDAQWGYRDVFESGDRPKLFFAETVDQEYLASLKKYLRTLTADEVRFVLISKSGATTETIAIADFLRVPPLQTAVITDEGSALWDVAGKKKFARLSMPATVGGRYSVFSPVGIVPLALAGYDVAKLLRGARAMRDVCTVSNSANPAVSSAAILSLLAQKGVSIHDTFFFHPELESLGKWYRQLLGESIGKTTKVGITPTVSLGSTDLHSVGQLYLGGPRDKVTTFVSASPSKKAEKISGVFSKHLIPDLCGQTLPQIMDAILRGVLRAYEKKKLPYMAVTLLELSPEELGGWMQWKMMETMVLGHLLGVNAFDQPNVEEYKAETRKFLKSR